MAIEDWIRIGSMVIISYSLVSIAWLSLWTYRCSRLFANYQRALTVLDSTSQNYKRWLAYHNVLERMNDGVSMNPLVWVKLWKDTLEPTSKDFEYAEHAFLDIYPLRPITTIEAPTTHCFDCGRLVLIADVWTKKYDPNYALCEVCFRRAETVGRVKESL